ncbi:MAG: hypothetical protein UW46_C0001G0102 [Candidatus Yanofskybacteria bacterium GW2011_GWF1_44_227]|uniref:Uncharacterized protein n=1 Tax=Candidatus Yanofskybacteria bacterium GW2011_GWE2_40_11 TaxID=1619033 RepID=A0A0G0QLZ6_9BACT|nr:MAG: hypothetical protein UT69_C0013G0032 [Candidatus Yanofskybacteria bacterium GW2011_GWE1_40_10]KKR41128.1 MAG: hypothetical protein UT75_C0001G0032 [Candidatus Yanofskybacteria bacterium GW2011_GWE2_40_11]KKT15875.1 MAG: hypothetical protein UV97_C0001G0048 [Candidatus Yanofskybacteria bacterium GW2011_GWF2_43_596]KKT53612.1 MAG: hypothetical protein UW46_C0001G0102 [Candidatus Yanofskybacteria bacterium GW2011_GWF1_44_227]OGN36261.1 MAG: hypothetical protein A2241_00775 [Candidatus Yano
MGYAAIILVIATIILGTYAGPGLSNTLKDGLISNIGEGFKDLIPKSENEIIIESINSTSRTLEDFFNNSANQILSAKDVSTEDKEALKKSIQAFVESKDLNAKIETKLKSEESQGLVSKIVDKVIGIGTSSINNATTNNNPPETTYIPPQCKMVCDP